MQVFLYNPSTTLGAMYFNERMTSRSQVCFLNSSLDEMRLKFAIKVRIGACAWHTVCDCR